MHIKSIELILEVPRVNVRPTSTTPEVLANVLVMHYQDNSRVLLMIGSLPLPFKVLQANQGIRRNDHPSLSSSVFLLLTTGLLNHSTSGAQLALLRAF